MIVAFLDQAAMAAISPTLQSRAAFAIFGDDTTFLRDKPPLPHLMSLPLIFAS